MDPSSPEVHVDDQAYPDAPAHLIEAAVRVTLQNDGDRNVGVSVALLPDDEMRRLNDQFLGRDRPTDVLAFALEGGDSATLGDIYLGYEQAARQAEEAGVSLSEELVRLAVHGTLHVLGHDHPEGPERLDSPMFHLQERLVGQLMREVGRDG